MRIAWSLRRITLLALACTLIGLGGLMYLYKQGVMDQSYVPVDQEKVLDGENIRSFSLSADIANVDFVPAPGNELRIRLTGEINQADLSRANISIESGSSPDVVAVVNSQERFQFGIDVTRVFNFFDKKLRIVVELPDKTYQKLKVKTNTGRITLPALRADNLELQTDTGEITLGGFTGSKLTASTDTATLRLQHIAAGLDLRSDTGHIMADLDALPDNASLRTDTGDIEITLNKPLPLKADFASDTGKTSLSGGEAPADFDVKEKHKLIGRLAGGGPLIKARSDTGDISVIVK